MTTRLYVDAANEILKGNINFETDDLRVALVNTDLYTPNFVTDGALSDIPAAAQIALSTDLANKTVSSKAMFNADEYVFSALDGDTVHAFVLYKQSNELILYNDDAPQFPVAPNGIDDVSVDWHEDGILSLPLLGVATNLFYAAAIDLMTGTLDLDTATCELKFMDGYSFDPLITTTLHTSIIDTTIEDASASMVNSVVDGEFQSTNTTGTTVGGAGSYILDGLLIYSGTVPIVYMDHLAEFPLDLAAAPDIQVDWDGAAVFKIVP